MLLSLLSHNNYFTVVFGSFVAVSLVLLAKIRTSTLREQTGCQEDQVDLPSDALLPCLGIGTSVVREQC